MVEKIYTQDDYNQRLREISENIGVQGKLVNTLRKKCDKAKDPEYKKELKKLLSAEEGKLQEMWQYKVDFINTYT